MIRTSIALTAVLVAAGIACSLFGGNWMRTGAGLIGTGCLSLGALLSVDLRGEASDFIDRHDRGTYASARAFGVLFLIVGSAFLVACAIGGPEVTKPGIF